MRRFELPQVGSVVSDKVAANLSQAIGRPAQMAPYPYMEQLMNGFFTPADAMALNQYNPYAGMQRGIQNAAQMYAKGGEGVAGAGKALGAGILAAGAGIGDTMRDNRRIQAIERRAQEAEAKEERVRQNKIKAYSTLAEKTGDPKWAAKLAEAGGEVPDMWTPSANAGLTPAQAAVDADRDRKFEFDKQKFEASQGDLERTAKEQEAKAAQATAMTEGQRAIVQDDIRKAKEIAETQDWSTGWTGAVGQYVPGTSGYDLKKRVDSIKASIGFDRLQQMRASSKNGAALGPVSDKENELLQATFGSLVQSQSKEEFVYNLDRLQAYYDAVVNDPSKLPQLLGQYGKAPGASAAPEGGDTPQPGEVDNGYEFIGGDPGDPKSWRPVQ
jgi:hypothetical protein